MTDLFLRRNKSNSQNDVWLRPIGQDPPLDPPGHKWMRGPKREWPARKREPRRR